MRGFPHLLQTWLLAHVRPFCSSHPFSYISDERSLIERLAPVIPPPDHSFSEWRRFWRELTPAHFLWVARWNPDDPMITGCPGIVGVPLLSHLGSTLIFPGRHPTDEERAFSATSAYVARFYPQGSTPPQRSQATPTPRATSTLAPEAESSIQAAMHAKLRAVKEERDRLRCELVDSRAEVADYRELQTELTRARARVAHLDLEMARLSAQLDQPISTAAGPHGRPSSTGDLPILGARPVRASAVSIPTPAMAYTVPPSMVFPATSAPAPTHLQATELPPYLSLQPHAGLSYQAPPPINTSSTNQARRPMRPNSPHRRTSSPRPTPNKSREESEGGFGKPRQYGTSGAPAIFGESHDHTNHRSYLLSSTSTAPTSVDLLFSPTGPTADDLTTIRPLCTRLRSALSTHTPGVESSSTGATESYFAGSTGRRHAKPTPQTILTIARSSLSHISVTLGGESDSVDILGSELRPRRIDSNRLTFNAVRPPNVQVNPLPDHRPSSGPSINMISICASGRDEEVQENPLPFVINYTPEELIVEFTGHVASPAPFVVDIHAREPYSDSKVPWTYEGSVGSVEQQFSVMGVTRSGRVYENSAAKDKGKAPVVEVGAAPESSPFPPKKALLPVLTAAPVPKETPPNMMEETVGSIFSNTISFSDDDLPSEGWSHSRALHIVCKCNNYIIGRMNVDLNRGRPSKTAVRAFDGSRREVNGEIDLLIDVGSCSFSITFQVLDIPNAFSLLLGRPWIHSAGAVPSSLHQRLKFIVEDKLITVKGEEDYAIYKETASGPSRADRMIGNVLLRNNYIPGIGLGARGQGINRPIEVEGYKHRRGLGFRPSCHEIIEARKGNHLHRLAAYYGRLNRGTLVPPLSRFFPGPSHTIGGTLDSPSSDSDDTPATPLAVCAVTEEIPSGVHIRLAQENEELDNWTSVPRYSAVIVDHYPVEKDGRVRVYVNYRDLNKASPKDNFPLPHIDVLVDNTAHHAQFSFMDGFSRYNQIRMAEKDKLKTTFTTMWGTFCYRVMPFSLKNAGATNQRAMVTLFHDMMHKEVECTFGARSGKLLGLVVSERSIEVDPDKVKAIKELPPPSTVREEWAKNFERISFTYTPRTKNQFADALATLASMASISEGNIVEPLEIEVAKGPAHCNAIEVSEAKPWYEDIKNFLQTGQYPPFADRRDRKTLRRLTMHYFLSGKILYRRSFDSMLLRCIDEHESRRLMEEVHGGNCGPYMNGLMLAKKIMRLGYYWSTMETDCVKHWIESITLASVTTKAVARFLRHDVIARYGVPATIITDNAKNLNNKVIDELCAQFKIRHRNSTPYNPQMNGAVEAANKNIKKIIEKMTCYQQRMARAFNAKVRPREFSPGDLVLRKVLHVAPDPRGKFLYKYDGPFVVKEIFSGGAVILSDMDGTENALPVNADNIKKYYP
ncbi:hypothetical protein CRG98_007834 [Punica granatum]|uniref:Uncharacterized protein n=1 Tax=Punica granatum TaxID=22663 RepID=A0A2I0KTH8_PUNGR|nr:hypothetical protein CRG98_007834 [Punica granatum]